MPRPGWSPPLAPATVVEAMRQDSARSPTSIFLRLGRSIQTVRMNVKTAVWGWFRPSCGCGYSSWRGRDRNPKRHTSTSHRHIGALCCTLRLPAHRPFCMPAEERRTPADFPNLQQTIAQFVDWALDNRESLTLLLAAVGLVVAS